MNDISKFANCIYIIRIALSQISSTFDLLKRLPRATSWIVLVCCLSYTSSAQTSVGIQKFGAYDGSVDTVDVGTLDVHLRIAIFRKTGRGRDADVALTLNDSAAWPVPWAVGPGGVSKNFSRGLGLSIGHLSGHLTKATSSHPCATNSLNTYTDYVWTYVDFLGNSHLFPGNSRSVLDGGTTCSSHNIFSYGLTAQASDGSGYLFQIGNSGYFPTTVTTPAGTILPLDHSSEFVGGLQDSNGNTIGIGASAPGAVCAGLSPCTDGNGNIVSYTAQDTVGTSIQLSGGGYNADFSARNPLVLTYFDDSGAPHSIALNYRMYQISGSTETQGFLDNVQLPDGSAYHFTYLTDQNGALTYVAGSSGGPAILTSITLPSGGVISYGYPSGVAAPTGISGCAGLTYIPSLIRTTSDGATSYSRTIASGSSTPFCTITSSNTQVVKPNGDVTKAFFVVPQHFAVYCPFSSCNSLALGWLYDTKVLETARVEYSGSNLSQPLRTSMRCYNGATGDCSVTPVNEPVTQLAVKTTLENGLSSQVVTVYTGNGLPAEVDEYDFGVSTPTRKTITAYASLGNNISDRPDSVTVYDAAGNVASKTTYKYDEAVPQPMTLPGHVTVSGSRGNPTTVTEWINNSGTATRVTHYAYDDAGQITSITDPLGNATSYNYDAATDAYRTRVTRPTTAGVAHTSTFAYGPNSGFLVSSVDENGQSATYIYDSMFRPSSVSYPGGGQTTYTYTPTSRTTNVLLSPGILLPTVEQNDGYGRKLRVTKPDGSMTDFTYDSLARLSTQGNPHFASSSPTDGVTTYQYDALDRVTQVAQPDGTVPTPGSTCLANNICNSYSGNTATVSDQAGNPRRSVTDALGRLIQVDEPGSSFAGSVSLGTLTIGGTLRSQAGVGATPGTGTITIGGAWFSIDMLRW